MSGTHRYRYTWADTDTAKDSQDSFHAGTDSDSYNRQMIEDTGRRWSTEFKFGFALG